MFFLQRFVQTVFFLLIFNLIFSLPAFAFQNEPDGFRGIKWSTNINELSDMTLAQGEGDIKVYTRKNDKMQIGDAQLERIGYKFYKDRFYSVIVEFSTDFLKIKDTLFQVYGDGYQEPNSSEYSWGGSKLGSKILIILNEERLQYWYSPILKEVFAAEDAKAKEAGKDL